MRERPMGYVYVIAGVMDFSANWDGVQLMVNEKYGAHRTLISAQCELAKILAEAMQERDDLDYKLDDMGLDIEYSDGTFEEYHIYKMLLN
jgi:hypothetical protein